MLSGDFIASFHRCSLDRGRLAEEVAGESREGSFCLWFIGRGELHFVR
jgi:hypothetical protein